MASAVRRNGKRNCRSKDIAVMIQWTTKQALRMPVTKTHVVGCCGYVLQLLKKKTCWLNEHQLMEIGQNRL